MNGKKIGKAFFFPHIILLILLLPLSIALLIYSMMTLADTDPFRIASYVVSFYTLVIWCIRFPGIIRYFKVFKKQNKYLRTWLEHPDLRVRVTLTANVLWNTAYAILQSGLAIYHHSGWFYSLAGYYFSLSLMRLCLVQYVMRHKTEKDIQKELLYYRICGWVFLFTNLALSGMIFYMIYENRIIRHHEITTIAMATYTFTSLFMAIRNVIKYRKYHSPVFSASKAISLASSCVSMLTLEGTMLATFSKGSMPPQTYRLFLSLSGCAVSMIIIVMAIYMIHTAGQKLNNSEENHGSYRK